MGKYLDLRQIIGQWLIFTFLLNTFGEMPPAYAESTQQGMFPVQAQDFVLPVPGAMVHLSPAFNPPILKGIKVHPDNPLRFDFILDRGDGQLSNDALKDESSKLIKYFLASLTIPEKDLWVNLSPYEKDRIIPSSFGLTEMGRDLLAEDYMLKQITASLVYPEDEMGKKFWKRIYEVAKQKFGTTNIPVNTFNKVWIIPEKAVVYENAKAGTAYVVDSRLKVMLEQDYLSLKKHEGIGSIVKPRGREANQLGSQIVRELVIPQLTKEVNENKNFAQLRQVYNSLILATWYKKKIKESILEQVYADKSKVAGVNIDDPKEKERIYARYLQAFKKGVFNYIKEEIMFGPDTPSKGQGTLPRKYFSGGEELINVSQAMLITHRLSDAAQNAASNLQVTVDVTEASNPEPHLVKPMRLPRRKPGSFLLRRQVIARPEGFSPRKISAKSVKLALIAQLKGMYGDLQEYGPRYDLQAQGKYFDFESQPFDEKEKAGIRLLFSVNGRTIEINISSGAHMPGNVIVRRGYSRYLKEYYIEMEKIIKDKEGKQGTIFFRKKIIYNTKKGSFDIVPRETDDGIESLVRQMQKDQGEYPAFESTVDVGDTGILVLNLKNKEGGSASVYIWTGAKQSGKVIVRRAHAGFLDEDYVEIEREFINAEGKKEEKALFYRFVPHKVKGFLDVEQMEQDEHVESLARQLSGEPGNYKDFSGVLMSTTKKDSILLNLGTIVKKDGEKKTVRANIPTGPGEAGEIILSRWTNTLGHTYVESRKVINGKIIIVKSRVVKSEDPDESRLGFKKLKRNGKPLIIDVLEAGQVFIGNQAMTASEEARKTQARIVALIERTDKPFYADEGLKEGLKGRYLGTTLTKKGSIIINLGGYYFSWNMFNKKEKKQYKVFIDDININENGRYGITLGFKEDSKFPTRRKIPQQVFEIGDYQTEVPANSNTKRKGGYRQKFVFDILPKNKVALTVFKNVIKAPYKFNAQKAVRDLKSIQKHLMGKTNEKGNLFILRSRDFDDYWPVLGTHEAGYDVVLEDAVVNQDGYCEIKVKLSKDGKEIEKSFEIGRFLQGPDDQPKVLDIVPKEEVARRVIEAAISRNKVNVRRGGLLTRQEHFLGEVSGRGEIIITPYSKYKSYIWSVLGFTEEGWSAYLVRGERNDQGLLEYEVRLEKKGERSFTRIFEIGRTQTYLEVDARRKFSIKPKERLAVYDIEAREDIGHDIFKGVLFSEDNYNPLEIAEKLKHIKGYPIAQVYSDGKIYFTVDGFEYHPFLGPREFGWQVILKDAMVKGKRVRVEVIFTRHNRSYLEGAFEINNHPTIVKSEDGRTRTIRTLRRTSNLPDMTSRNIEGLVGLMYDQPGLLNASTSEFIKEEEFLTGLDFDLYGDRDGEVIWDGINSRRVTFQGFGYRQRYKVVSFWKPGRGLLVYFISKETGKIYSFETTRGGTAVGHPKVLLPLIFEGISTQASPREITMAVNGKWHLIDRLISVGDAENRVELEMSDLMQEVEERFVEFRAGGVSMSSIRRKADERMIPVQRILSALRIERIPIYDSDSGTVDFKSRAMAAESEEKQKAQILLLNMASPSPAIRMNVARAWPLLKLTTEEKVRMLVSNIIDPRIFGDAKEAWGRDGLEYKGDIARRLARQASVYALQEMCLNLQEEGKIKTYIAKELDQDAKEWKPLEEEEQFIKEHTLGHDQQISLLNNLRLMVWAEKYRLIDPKAIPTFVGESISKIYPKKGPKDLVTQILYNWKENPAMVGLDKTGGIDLSSANMHSQTRNNGGAIKFHMDPAMLKQLQNAPGFVPVIINIQPVTDLRQWLGL